METKPAPTDPMDAASFDRWYWDKPELTAICVALGLPRAGGKDALRQRILTYLETGEVIRPEPRKRTKFNWARADLSRETVITDGVSFGPNFRGFMTREIGAGFVCHSDFMDWVRAHPGKTLGDAIEAWHALEARKDDPGFRREIAPHNNYLQYLRDYRDANPDHSMDAAKSAWQARKSEPISDERIRYRPKDAKRG